MLKKFKIIVAAIKNQFIFVELVYFCFQFIPDLIGEVIDIEIVCIKGASVEFGFFALI